MRILVAGIGGIGGWLLARLTEGGADVAGWARGATYERLAAGDPLVLRSRHGDWSGPVRVVSEPDGPYDLVVVATKSQHTATVSPALPGGAVVVSAQNGVENPDVLRRHHTRVVPAVVYAGCERIDPVTIVHRSNGFLALEDAEVAGWLQERGVGTRVVDDVRAAMWQKLMANVCVNSLTAITGLAVGELFAGDHVDAVALEVLREVAAVAAAEDVVIPEGYPELVLEGIRSLPGDATPSTLQDRRAGRGLEVDALTGAVVRRAARHGVPVPTVATLDALLRAVSPTG